MINIRNLILAWPQANVGDFVFRKFIKIYQSFDVVFENYGMEYKLKSTFTFRYHYFHLHWTAMIVIILIKLTYQQRQVLKGRV